MRKNIKTRRTIISLICAAIFMTQAITAAAACDCGCNKETCVHITDYRSEIIYTPTNGTSHIVELVLICKCTECYVVTEHPKVEYQNCTWAGYADLGHLAGGNHKYRLTCGLCHGTYDVTVPCEGGRTGNHQTPW